MLWNSKVLLKLVYTPKHPSSMNLPKWKYQWHYSCIKRDSESLKKGSGYRGQKIVLRRKGTDRINQWNDSLKSYDMIENCTLGQATVC